MYRIFCSFLLASVLTACASDPKTQLQFVVKYQGEHWRCDNNDLSLMMYLSNFNQGEPLALVASEFASESVALLGGDCSEQAWRVELNKHLKQGQSLSFDLGVPFQQNHSNPLQAKPPLNASEMFWSWQLGHKFLRLDQPNHFSFHLGSTGCKSPSRMRAATEACQQPNRFTYQIEQFDPAKAIIFDLDRLLAEVETKRTCMSEQGNPVCQALFTNLRQAVFYQD